jgi:kynurenine formamidase
MRIIDLSHVIQSSPEGTPDFLRTDVSYNDHAQGASEFEKLVGVPRRLLRDEEGPASERLSIGTHATTHLDAPWHYNSTIGGEPSPTIDQLPVEQFFGPGVVVDARHKEDGDAVTCEEMERGIAGSGHDLSPCDIVLVHSGRDAYYDDPGYMWRGPGVSVDATRWLFDSGVRVMGIDAWGWDAPLDKQAKAALERDEPGVMWAAHQCNLPYSQIERLTNLGALPATGFQVACFPLKIRGAIAAPARVVALVPDGDHGGNTG